MDGVPGCGQQGTAGRSTGDYRGLNTLVRLAGDAYGRTPPATPPDDDAGDEWEKLPREQRSAIAARLLREADELERAFQEEEGGHPAA